MNRRIAIAAVPILFAAALLYRIDAPFLRHRESVPAYFANAARNHVRLGLGQTRLGMIEISSPDPDVYPNWRAYFYPNRPFVSALVTSGWFRLFGVSEAVMRLSLIAASLGALFAFLKLVERLIDPKWAPLALAFFALNPLFWYFSIIAVHLVYALAFSLAAWACWVRWDESRRSRILMGVFLGLACESDWPGYYAAISIGVDALLSHRRRIAAGVALLAAASFALHLLHLLWIDPEHGPLIRRFLAAGAGRSVQGLPGPLAFLVSQGREAALYFTVGMIVLAGVGVRRLPRRVWLLAILGLDELVFSRWAHVHDFLQYSLTPFVAAAAAVGVESLWTSASRKAVASALIVLAALQSVWITGDRLTRRGANEVLYRAGVAIRERTAPRDRVLITVADERQFTPYYADRYTAGVEPEESVLMVHPSGVHVPVAGVEDLAAHFHDFSVVLVGDPDGAAKEIGFFRGQKPPESFRFLEATHPLRRSLETLATSKETHGAFVLYRLREPYSPR
ncbi:MAG TPA: glycosyltransferase family 39 protein [Planctomycetota bacterium]|nr:glycosyltransferase family 39 protein [Planctomycetota bacterium]